MINRALDEAPNHCEVTTTVRALEFAARETGAGPGRIREERIVHICRDS